MPIKEGYYVKVEYTGTLEDGTLFDSSEAQGEPLEFQIGAGQVIEGFERAIVDMELGEEKEFTLQPEDAYGEYLEDMVRDIPRDRLPIDDLEPGTALMATLPTGMQVPVTVKAVSEETVSIDLNHPLAGKVLNFWIKLLEIREGELEDCGPDCGPGCAGCGH